MYVMIRCRVAERIGNNCEAKVKVCVTTGVNQQHHCLEQKKYTVPRISYMVRRKYQRWSQQGFGP